MYINIATKFRFECLPMPVWALPTSPGFSPQMFEDSELSGGVSAWGKGVCPETTQDLSEMYSRLLQGES